MRRYVHLMELCLWGKSVLVARLKPVDADSREALRKLEERRIQLMRQWASTYGFAAPDKPEKYVPHISLGYFPNPDLAAQAEPNTHIIDSLPSHHGRIFLGHAAEDKPAVRRHVHEMANTGAKPLSVRRERVRIRAALAWAAHAPRRGSDQILQCPFGKVALRMFGGRSLKEVALRDPVVPVTDGPRSLIRRD
jgi:hypothetical protein